MRNLTFFALVCFSVQFVAVSQENPIAKKYGDQLKPEDLKAYLSVIAADSMEGRETGKPGQKMAASYIQSQFKDFGLKAIADSGYYQKVPLYKKEVQTCYLKIGNKNFQNYEEVIFYGSAYTDGEQKLPVVFLGNGKPENFDHTNVKGKAVLLMLEPGRISTNPAVALARQKGAKLVLVSNSITTEEFNVQASWMRMYLSEGNLSLDKPGENGSAEAPIFILSPTVVREITGKEAKVLRGELAVNDRTILSLPKSSSVQYNVINNVQEVRSENVLGFLEGTDKKDEVVLVTAHYDHIGLTSPGSEDPVNNGADDDGSGTVTVVELARLFSAAKKEGNGPRRSMLFMTVTGEEEGLLGSEYYTDHPIIPLSSTVVDLNIDMIGRTDGEHKDKDDYVYVIGSDKLSMALHALSERVNATYTQLDFDYLYNDEHHPTNLYQRSDHWNFAKHDVPIIFYFDGIHEDYHKPSDEVDKIQFDLLAKRGKCIFYTAWEIANREERIVPDKKSK